MGGRTELCAAKADIAVRYSIQSVVAQECLCNVRLYIRPESATETLYCADPSGNSGGEEACRNEEGCAKGSASTVGMLGILLLIEHALCFLSHPPATGTDLDP